MTETTVEYDIQAKGKTAARVTPEDVERAIEIELYFTAGDACRGINILRNGERARNVGEPHKSFDLLTICVLVLKNGFTVTGESACASPENFDEALGRRIARAKAVEKVWPLLGFELKTKLAACSAE